MTKTPNRAKGAEAKNAKLTPQQRKNISQAMLEAKREKKHLPAATHTGGMKLADATLSVAILDTGQRIITSAAVFQAFGRTQRGNGRIEGVPVFVDAKNLQPYFLDEERRYLQPVSFIANTGVVKTGYDVRILATVCEAYLALRRDKKATASQQALAMRAEILMGGFARVGLVAMVNAAVGIVEDENLKSLTDVLNTFVQYALRKWTKEFPLEFYTELCRLYDQPIDAPNHRYPPYFGRITNNIVYGRLAPGLVERLKKEQAKNERRGKMHQYLTDEIGAPKLREHLTMVVGLMKASDTKEDFYRMLNRAAPILTLPECLEETGVK